MDKTNLTIIEKALYGYLPYTDLKEGKLIEAERPKRRFRLPVLLR